MTTVRELSDDANVELLVDFLIERGIEPFITNPTLHEEAEGITTMHLQVPKHQAKEASILLLEWDQLPVDADAGVR